MSISSAILSNHSTASVLFKLGQQNTHVIADHSPVALLYGSPEPIREIIESIVENHDVSYIRVADANNVTLIEIGETDHDFSKMPSLDHAYSEDDKNWYFQEQVYISAVTDLSEGDASVLLDLPDGGSSLGQVQLVYNKRQLLKLRNQLIFMNLTLTVSSILIGLLLLNRLMKKLLLPLNQLAKTMSADSNVEHLCPAKTTGAAEIESIAHAYNKLLALVIKSTAELKESNNTLEDKVATRTKDLQHSNNELRAFSYSVSHDLRAPLRSIDGFSLAVIEDYGDQLDDEAVAYLQRVRKSTHKMGDVIDDMMYLSRVSMADLSREDVDLQKISHSIIEQLHEQHPNRQVQFECIDLVPANIDRRLATTLMSNLLGNAWRYSAGETPAIIRLYMESFHGTVSYVLEDNGVGFDMAYYDKLFEPFRRLHKQSEFEGSGIGLATVSRIIQRHGGMVWAESQVGEGAKFYFTFSGSEPSGASN